MMFSIVPPLIDRFEELGYARCGYSKKQTGFKRVSKGDIFEVARLVNEDDLKYYLYFNDQRGKFKVYYFKPATRKEYEKYRMMEELS